MLIGRPFELSTDLQFLYQGEEHERVFQEILKAIERREGLICVTGETGTGKSLLCQRLLAEINGAFQPIFLSTPPPTPKDINNAVDENLDESENKIPVLIIDEAQHLSRSCLDHIKILWNLRREDGNLLHVVLVGQPDLIEKLSQKYFRPLAQRVGANLNLKGLNRDEVLPYLTYRLAKAELSGIIRFTQGSANQIFRSTSGIPRLINRIAAVAVERAIAKGKSKITAWDVHRAQLMMSLLETRTLGTNWKRRWALAGSLVLLGAVALTLFLYGPSVSSMGKNFLSMNKKERVAPQPRYAVKIGTYLAKEEAADATQVLVEDGFKVLLQEQKLADGWTVYNVYLRDRLVRAEADKTASLLHKRYGIESSVVNLP